jgi:hypothetical protein
MLSLEMHKPMNHTVDGGGCGCCGIHGGIPYSIACAPGVGAHGDTCPPLPMAVVVSVPGPTEGEESEKLLQEAPMTSTSSNLHLEVVTTSEVA